MLSVVTNPRFISRLQLGYRTETRPSDPFFSDGAFESCAQLSALFDHGEVRRSTLWDGR